MGYEQFHVSYGGTVPLAVYLGWQRRSDQLWFRPATGTFTARTAGDSPVPYRAVLTNTGGDSFVLTTPPANPLPATTGDDVYVVHYWNQLTDPATDNDDLLLSEEVGWSGVSVTAPADYTGRYTDSNELRDFIGNAAALDLSNTSGSGVENPDAIQQSIEWGEGQVDLHAAGGVGLIPLDFAVTAAGTVGRLIVQRWATGLSVYHLAQKRGLTGVQLQVWAALRDEILAEIKAYREGTLVLPGVVEDPNNQPDQPGEMAFVPISFPHETCTSDEFAA